MLRLTVSSEACAIGLQSPARIYAPPGGPDHKLFDKPNTVEMTTRLTIIETRSARVVGWNIILFCCEYFENLRVS